MDQELIAYLDRRFDGIEKRLDGHDQQFISIAQRFDRMEKRLDAGDQQFISIAQRFDRMEETIRHTNISLEALRDEIRLVAEAVDLNDKKTERRFQALGTELKQEIADVRALVKRSYPDLDRRVKALEAKAS